MATTRQDLSNFLIDLSEFYPIEKNRDLNKVISETVEFLLPNCWDKRIDFQRLKTAIFNDYEYKSFPGLKYLKDMLPRGFKGDMLNEATAGEKKILRLPNGYFYEFEVTNFGKPWKDIVYQEEEKHKPNQIVTETYPKGTIVMGKNVYKPDHEYKGSLDYGN